MNNLFPSLPPLPVYVPTGGSGRVEVIDVRQDNDDDVNTSGKAGTQILHPPLGDDSSPRGR
jgi:hypothetical protein